MKRRVDGIVVFGLCILLVVFSLNFIFAEVQFPKPPNSPTDYGPGETNDTNIILNYSQGDSLDLNLSKQSNDNLIFGEYNFTSFGKLILVLFILILAGLTIKYFVDKYK